MILVEIPVLFGSYPMDLGNLLTPLDVLGGPFVWILVWLPLVWATLMSVSVMSLNLMYVALLFFMYVGENITFVDSGGVLLYCRPWALH